MNPSVYWQRHETPRAPPLRGDASSEVVVVGGGIAGLTCAQTLAERGVEVSVVERAFCGSGASGRSSGFITPDSELELSDLVANHGHDLGRRLWEFARWGVERIRRTIEERALGCDYQVQDSLFVASRARAFRKVVAAEHRTHQALGYRSRLYDAKSLETIVGSRAFHGGVRYAETFGIDSYAYCRGLRDALQRSGVRFYEDTPVLRLDAHGVEAPGGRVKAAWVVVLNDKDLPTLGLAAPEVHHVRSFLAISQPLRRRQIDAVFPSGDRLMVWDTDLVYHYFRITGEGRLLLGSARLRDMYSAHGDAAGAGIVRTLRRYLARHFPSLDYDFEFIWSGLIGVSKDFVPVAGRHPSLPRVYFAGAAAGLPWAAALGAYLADKVSHGRDELDAVLSADRPFAIGPPLQSFLGKPLAFLLSHGTAKYLRKG